MSHERLGEQFRKNNKPGTLQVRMMAFEQNPPNADSVIQELIGKIARTTNQMAGNTLGLKKDNCVRNQDNAILSTGHVTPRVRTIQGGLRLDEGDSSGIGNIIDPAKHDITVQRLS